MKKLITVTQEHIDKGQPGDACGCPLYLALNEAGVKVDGVGLFLAWTGKDEPIPLPDVCIQFLNRFDSHKPCAPFTFEMELP